MSFLDAKAARQDDPQMVALLKSSSAPTPTRWTPSPSPAPSASSRPTSRSTPRCARPGGASSTRPQGVEAPGAAPARRQRAEETPPAPPSMMASSACSTCRRSNSCADPPSKPTNVVPVSGKISVGVRAPLWEIGSTVKLRFLEGKPAVHKRVKEVALEWLEYANLNFDFGDYPDADVRIAFKPDMGTGPTSARTA